METGKETFEKMAKAVPVNPPPLWPELPPAVLKRFPELKGFTEQCREFFRQQQNSTQR